jgi:hypothetical protein
MDREAMRREAMARALLETGVMHPSGKPIYIDPEGFPETEKSVTVSDPRLNGGQFTNLPSIWNGYQLNDDDAVVRAAVQSGIPFRGFADLATAEQAAIARSQGLGAQMPHIPGMDYRTGQLTPEQVNRMWQRGY